MCIRLASLRSIAGLPDKYGPWNELYRARPALVRFGIAAAVPASKPVTARSSLPVTQSYENIHRQNWLAEPGPLLFRKSCAAGYRIPLVWNEFS